MERTGRGRSVLGLGGLGRALTLAPRPLLQLKRKTAKASSGALRGQPASAWARRRRARASLWNATRCARKDSARPREVCEVIGRALLLIWWARPDSCRLVARETRPPCAPSRARRTCAPLLSVAAQHFGVQLSGVATHAAPRCCSVPSCGSGWPIRLTPSALPQDVEAKRSHGALPESTANHSPSPSQCKVHAPGWPGRCGHGCSLVTVPAFEKCLSPSARKRGKSCLTHFHARCLRGAASRRRTRYL